MKSERIGVWKNRRQYIVRAQLRGVSYEEASLAWRVAADSGIDPLTMNEEEWYEAMQLHHRVMEVYDENRTDA